MFKLTRHLSLLIAAVALAVSCSSSKDSSPAFEEETFIHTSQRGTNSFLEAIAAATFNWQEPSRVPSGDPIDLEGSRIVGVFVKKDNTQGNSVSLHVRPDGTELIKRIDLGRFDRGHHLIEVPVNTTFGDGIHHATWLEMTSKDGPIDGGGSGGGSTNPVGSSFKDGTSYDDFFLCVALGMFLKNDDYPVFTQDITDNIDGGAQQLSDAADVTAINAVRPLDLSQDLNDHPCSVDLITAQESNTNGQGFDIVVQSSEVDGTNKFAYFDNAREYLANNNLTSNKGNGGVRALDFTDASARGPISMVLASGDATSPSVIVENTGNDLQGHPNNDGPDGIVEYAQCNFGPNAQSANVEHRPSDVATLVITEPVDEITATAVIFQASGAPPAGYNPLAAQIGVSASMRAEGGSDDSECASISPKFVEKARDIFVRCDDVTYDGNKYICASGPHAGLPMQYDPAICDLDAFCGADEVRNAAPKLYADFIENGPNHKLRCQQRWTC